MFGITIENYSALWCKNEEECRDKIRKLMDEGKITEVVEAPHPTRLNSKKCDWVAYVR